MRSKSRLTITLSPDLLRQVDRMIDKQRIRSRSHAIETLLRQSLQPRVSTAVLLAGGDRPAIAAPAIAPIGGKALITRMIEHLMGFGVDSFVVLAGSECATIEAVLGDGEHLGARIRYVEERRPRGTAGALKAAQPYLEEGPFLALHADVLTNIDIGDFVDFHIRENTLATIAVKPRSAEATYGKVLLQGNRITRFVDQGASQGISIINTGVYLFKPEVLGLIPDDQPSRLEEDVFPQLAMMGELSAFLFQGIWFDVREPENRDRAQARWRQIGGARHAVTD